MKTIKFLALMSTLAWSLGFGNVANAALVQYTSQAEFDEATVDRIVETNDAAPLNGFLDVHNQTIGAITYPGYAFMTDPGFMPDLYDWGSGPILLVERNTSLSFEPTRAFSADFGTLYPGAFVTVTIDGVSNVIGTSFDKNLAFYGWISDTPFSSVSFSTSTLFLVMDNITVADAGDIDEPGEVPEPGTLALLGIAAALLVRKPRPTVS